MASKTTFAFVAVSLALTALSPLTAKANPEDDDTLSRMFPLSSLQRAYVSGYGIGWYDERFHPNICLVTSLGTQIALGGGATVIGAWGDDDFLDGNLQNIHIDAKNYYENARIWPNSPGWTEPVVVGGSLTIPAPCPPFLKPQCTLASGCGIQVRPVTVGPAIRTIAPQSGMVCSQTSSFIACVPTGAYWAVSWCKWQDAYFVERGRGSSQGVLGGTGLEDLAMSRDIHCGGAGYRVTNPTTQTLVAGYYDVSYLLPSCVWNWDYDVWTCDYLSSGFEGVTVSLLVPYGNRADETGYVVSCLETMVTEIDYSPSIPIITSGVVEDGEDWFLALDLDALFLEPIPSNWLASIETHLFGDLGRLAPGLYDLGGDNEAIGSDGNTVLGSHDRVLGPPPGILVPGDGILCDFGSLPDVPLPQCHNGVSDETGPYYEDEEDPDCYKPDPNLLGSVEFYDARDNSE